MLLNLDQLEKQLDKEEFQDRSMAAFWVINKQLQMFIDSQFTWYYDSQMTEKYFSEYIGIEYDSRMNERQIQSKEGKVDSSKALDASLVVTECSVIALENSNSEHAFNKSIIKPSNDPRCHLLRYNDCKLLNVNVLANEQQHTEQFEPNYDTYLLKKFDSNTTPDSINMSHMGGEIDQDAEQYQVKSPLLNAEFFKMKDMINELKAQLQAKNSTINNLKKQIKNVHEKSNEAKVKHDIDVIETINIKLEHKVAKLLKENETMKNHYKDLYDSIKVTRTKTIEQTTSLIAKNDEFKAQLQEKGFTIAALKNELRKLKGNSVDTKESNAFKSERLNFSKPWFASQVNVNNVLSKPVTPHYLPKVREYVLAKPHHVIAPGSSRNSQEESYGSNDMAHNHYLKEARKKTQERNRNSKSSVMHTTSLQITTNGSKQKPRSNNQASRSLPVSKSSGVTSNSVLLVDHSRNSSSFSDSKHFVCSTCQKCVFNANHDDCITKFLKEVNSRAKVQSPKTRNNNKPVEPKSHTQKPGRQIAIGQKFSLNKSSVVHEKPNTPRSCLRWKPTGRIFKTAGLRWIPTGKMFTDSTTKVDSEPPNGSNDDITNPYECD
ncbi:hypothetical protein Tco_1317457 [Tanacetum coccineum]